MNHDNCISEIKYRIKDNLMNLSIKGLTYVHSTTIQISREGITTDPGNPMISDFYSYEELPDSDLELILSQI